MKYCTYYRSKLSMCSLEYHFVVSLSRCIITQIVDTKTKFSWPIRHFNQFMLCSVCCMLPVRALHWLFPRSKLYWRSLISCAIHTDHCVKSPNIIFYGPLYCLVIYKFEHHTASCSRYACVHVYMRWIKWYWDTSKQRPFEGMCCYLTKY